MKKFLLILGLTSILLSVLSGCSSNSGGKIFGVPSDLGYTYRQLLPNEVVQHSGEQTITYSFIKFVNNNTADVFFVGSSSCPSTITSIKNVKNGQVKIMLKTWPGICSQTLASTGYQLTAVSTNFSFTKKTVYVCSKTYCSLLPSQRKSN